MVVLDMKMKICRMEMEKERAIISVGNKTLRYKQSGKHAFDSTKILKIKHNTNLKWKN